MHGGAGAGHAPQAASRGESASSRGGPASSQGAANQGRGGANFESRIAANPQLSSRLQSLLPAGTTLESAAAGFKNQGQFIAAVHVSHNLNIPFAQLQTAMTGPNHDSLGQAIRTLRPDLASSAVRDNVKLAERQAKSDVADTAKD